MIVQVWNESLTQAVLVPQACLALRQRLGINQSDLSNSTPSLPGPSSLEEDLGQPCYVEPLDMVRALTSVCPARLISLSLCQLGERGGCQRAQTRQQMGA